MAWQGYGLLSSDLCSGPDLSSQWRSATDASLLGILRGLRCLVMASFHGSDSPQYFVFQPLPDGLSDRQRGPARDKRLQDILVADLRSCTGRSAFVLITELQKTTAEMQLQSAGTATSPTISTPPTIKSPPSPAPHTPVSSCTPMDSEVPSLESPRDPRQPRALLWLGKTQPAAT